MTGHHIVPVSQNVLHIGRASWFSYGGLLVQQSKQTKEACVMYYKDEMNAHLDFLTVTYIMFQMFVV